MPKTKKIEVTTSDEVRITSSRNKTTVHVEEPEITELLQEIDDDDIADFVKWNNYKPGHLFDEVALNNWANENGYIKE